MHKPTGTPATQSERRKRFWAEFTRWLASAMDDELVTLEERLRSPGHAQRVGQRVSVAVNREVRRRVRCHAAVA